jgi:hypothetical protein
MGVLLVGVWVLLNGEGTVTGIGFLLLWLGWPFHGASFLPDRVASWWARAPRSWRWGFADRDVLPRWWVDAVRGRVCGAWGRVALGRGLFLPNRSGRGGLAFLLAGIGALQIGVLRLLDGDGPYGLAFLLLGAAGLLYGVSFLPDRLSRGGLAFLLIGAGGLQIGGRLLLEQFSWFNVGFLLLGIGGLLAGVSFLLGRFRLFGASFLVFSVAGLVLGLSLMRTRLDLAGITGLIGLISVALMLIGVACLLAGFALLYRSEQWQRVLVWLTTRNGVDPGRTQGGEDSLDTPESEKSLASR